MATSWSMIEELGLSSPAHSVPLLSRFLPRVRQVLRKKGLEIAFKESPKPWLPLPHQLDLPIVVQQNTMNVVDLHQ